MNTYRRMATCAWAPLALAGLLCAGEASAARADFNGNGKSDLAVFRPDGGMWYFTDTTRVPFTQTQWGSPGDIPVPGDYDGDGKADIATWRPSNGDFYVIQSSNGQVTTQQWGAPTDIPVPGDYDGDGKTDFAVWRPSNGFFYVIQSSNGQIKSQQWGTPTDIPVPVDYDGDGRTDFAVWRPSNGFFYVIQTSTGQVVEQQWGTPEDVPVPADYDGDHKADFAVWRPSTGDWWIIQTSVNQVRQVQWGAPTDLPVPADYDGDGTVDIAVWRPSTGNFYFNGNPQGVQWGEPADVPLTQPSAAIWSSLQPGSSRAAWDQTDDRALATKYAPDLRFDLAADSFPMSAQRYYSDMVVGSPSCFAQEEQTTLDPNAPTYFQVTRCDNQVRINYWFFYGLQHSCSGDLPGAACDNGEWNGYHNGDWEHVMVTLSEDESQIAAVTYYQHGYQYSRLAARSGYDTMNGVRPVVYAGKIAHGSFHDQGGVGGCGYWEDYRNYSGTHLDTAVNLVSLDDNEEPWMIPDRAGGFSWGPSGVNTHPTVSGPTCSMDSCSGESQWDDIAVNGDGCYKSQCEVGDDDSGVGCIEQCRSGYTDTGLLCSECSGTWYNPLSWSCDTYSKKLYAYSYPLPTTDLGLLIDNAN